MVFFTLLPKCYFGGRVLLPSQTKKKTADDKGQDMQRRTAWFSGKQNN